MSTPSVEKNQSQLRVPPMPGTASTPFSASGKVSPELAIALLLPADGWPMTMYQGSS